MPDGWCRTSRRCSYDQAPLVLAYVEGWQVTGNPEYARVVAETIGYVLRDLRDPAGGFYSSEDADSEGVEGKFYVWTLDEIRALLDEDEAALFLRAYDVDEVPNFEEGTILQRRLTAEQLIAGGYASTRAPEIEATLARARAKLFAARSRRVRPGRDEKILTAWNGFMISALARAGRALAEADYREAATRAAEFVWTRVRVDGILHRVHKDGRTRIPGYLEDYAAMTLAFVDLYEATFDLPWLERAIELTEVMRAEFEDGDAGGFRLTGARHDGLILKLKTGQDGGTPSGNALAATALFRLGRLTGSAVHTESALRTLRAFRTHLERVPMAFHQMLLAADLWWGPASEVVLAGATDTEQGRRLRREVDRAFLPRTIVARVEEGAGSVLAPDLISGRPATGEASVYVCRGFSCLAPSSDVSSLSAQLAQLSPMPPQTGE
ncbi:MAG: hypothetical protein R3E12_09925 [Candidatus Eisenbacteria bacterium]